VTSHGDIARLKEKRNSACSYKMTQNKIYFNKCRYI